MFTPAKGLAPADARAHAGTRPAAAGTPPEAGGEFIRVADARRRYFGGAMSLRWWYRQVERGTLPHYRAGGAVLLRPADVEAFVQGGFRAAGPPDSPPEAPPPPAAAPPVPRRRSPPPAGGLRFFGG
jgi:hypothetical protein